MQPLNSESILTKEQLFDMFQQILGVKKFEHQILFNALMVSWTSIKNILFVA
jgi:calcium-dependent secretion activator